MIGIARLIRSIMPLLAVALLLALSACETPHGSVSGGAGSDSGGGGRVRIGWPF